MEFADELFGFGAVGADLRRDLAGGLVDGQAPEATEEAGDADDTVGIPRLGGLERSEEHQVHAERIGAVVLDDGVRVHDVAAALGHLLAVLAHDEALVEEFLERFGGRQDADLVKEAVPEACVQQVEHGMLGAADIEVRAAPVFEVGLGGESLSVLGVDVAQVIPAGASPLGHGVGFARGLDPKRTRLWLGLRHGGAGSDVIPDFGPLGFLRERRVAGGRGLVGFDLRQSERELLGGQRHGADFDAIELASDGLLREELAHFGVGRDLGVVFAGDPEEREGLAPVALTREEPVAQLEVYGELTLALGLEFSGNLLLGLSGGEAIESTRVHHRAVFGPRLLVDVDRFLGANDLDNRQLEFLGEFPVAFVVRRHGHDRTRSVGDEHVVGGPDRDLGAVDGVYGVGAGEHASLLLGREVGALEVGLVADRGDIAFDRILLGGGGEFADERVLGRDDHVGCAVKGVRTRREDGQRVGMAIQFEGDFGALGFADPVLLEALGGIGPVDVVEAFDELVGVGGDAQDPLADGATFDRVAAAVGTRAFGRVKHFFVGEHRAEGRAEPDGLLGDVGETVAEELEEDPLRPAEVVLVGSRKLAVPVDGEAEHLELAAEVVDVALGLDGRVFARGNRMLLGGEAESVPAHWVEDVEAVGLLVAGEDVRSGVALGVADV